MRFVDFNRSTHRRTNHATSETKTKPTEQQRAAAGVKVASDLLTIIDALQPKMEIGDSVPAPAQLFSLGWVSQFFQIPPDSVRKLIARCHVQFTISINEVPHLAGSDLVTLTHEMRAITDKLAEAADAAIKPMVDAAPNN